MDSWTDKQLSMMKSGGNKKFNDSMKSKGISPDTKIKPKYESEHAQLYKERLKARVEGRPEPTSLPPPRNKRAAAPSSAPANNMGGFGSGGGGPKGSADPNGLERMTGETEQQYIARQTRLRAEAKARMQAKFGNGGNMGGVGSSMQGIGSNSSYNPNTGNYGGGYGAGAPDIGNVIGSVAGAFTSGLSLVSSAVNDESTRASVSNLASTATSYGGNLASTATSVGGSFWNSVKTTVGDVATAVAQPGEADGLASLQRDVQSHMPAKSKYSGFGSTNTASQRPSSSSSSIFDSFGMTSTMGGMGGMSQQQPVGGAPTPPTSGGVPVQEATGLPGEDRNGMERLTGESEQQYVARQTRLRDEAKARMAAKFGGGGLSSAGPSSSSYKPAAPSSGNSFGSMSSAPSSGGAALQEAPGMPGEDRNGMERLTGETDEQYVLRQTRLRDEAKARMAAKFGGGGLSSMGPPSSSSYTAAPSSANANAFGSMESAPAPAPSYPTGMSLGGKMAATPVKSAPSSFGRPKTGSTTPVRKNSNDSEDFFANFGA